MTTKIKYYCWTCAKPLRGELYVLEDGTVHISLKPCPRCLKRRYESGHIEGRKGAKRD